MSHKAYYIMWCGINEGYHAKDDMAHNRSFNDYGECMCFECANTRNESTYCVIATNGDAIHKTHA